MTAPDPARLHQSIRQLEGDGGRVDVEQLRGLLAADVTPLPWQVKKASMWRVESAIAGLVPEDGALIAAAVNNLPALLDLIRRQDAALTAVRELAYNGDDGSEYEHNDGCCGEAECPACWATDIRRALRAAELRAPARTDEEN